jgi:DNA excision repair protein ERCC-4
MPNGGVIECPFVLLIDQREKLPFSFAGLRSDARQGRLPLTVRTQRGYLPTGDYSIAGMEKWVAIERKSVADCFATVAQHRRRFERELARLQSLRFAAVVVEGDWREVLFSPPRWSQLSPKVVFRSVVAWQQRFPGCHWWFCPGRAMAEVVTYRLLERFHKDHCGAPGKGA